MPIVPYPTPAPARKRPSLDRESIVRAALAIVDEEGLDALTMRSLATRLRVKAASLYRHVKDKGELLVLMADAISGEIDLPDPSTDWQDWLREAANRLRTDLLAHRDAARILAETAPMGPRRLRLIETMLSRLAAAGLTPLDAVRAGYHLNNFVTEFVADEARMVLQQEAMSRAGVTPREGARGLFAGLAPEEFPFLAAHGELLADGDMEGLFRFGMDLWLAGLAQKMDRSAP